jgi:adenosylhomocysteine nucleosidase
MTHHMENFENSGVVTFGGKTVIEQSAIGSGASVTISTVQAPRQGSRSAGVGVITVIAEEAAAVRVSLGLEPVEVGGRGVDVGTVRVRGKQVTVAATRALAQGQESAMAAYGYLREHFHPAVIALAGIAGGIHRDVRLGDVVVATRVICYDLRKEAPSGTLYRGQEQQAPATIGHAVNEFFTGHGDPAEFAVDGSGEAEGIIRVFSGPIGSGNAVIADRDSDILKYLARFNDKILAVDMEAAGLSLAHHEDLAPSDRSLGWLVVRGISDDASARKNDGFHHIAARNAAFVLRELLPYLPVTPSGPRTG